MCVGDNHNSSLYFSDSDETLFTIFKTLITIDQMSLSKKLKDICKMYSVLGNIPLIFLLVPLKIHSLYLQKYVHLL